MEVGARDGTIGGAGRRAVLVFALIGVLLAAALITVVLALRATVYSASSFVGAYLGAVADHNTTAALDFPGVTTDAAFAHAGTRGPISHELLRSDVLGGLADVHTTGETVDAAGRHHVTVTYRLASAGATATGASAPVTAHSTFVVKPEPAIAGIFPRWSFAVSPLAVVHVAVENAHTFTVAGHTLDVRAASGDASQLFGDAGDYLVFAPSLMRLGHSDPLTEAEPVRVAVTKPAKVTDASVVVTPTSAFTARVQKQLDHYLDSCAKQKVLQPTGCPMGKRIDNRVLGSPTWSIAHYPAVNIVAGDDGWVMPSTGGQAELKVRVQSLFDGSISDETDTVPFTVSLESIAIQPDGSLAISVAG